MEEQDDDKWSPLVSEGGRDWKFFELKRAVEAGMTREVHLIVFSEVTAVQLNDFQLFYSPPLTSVYLRLIVDNYFF